MPSTPIYALPYPAASDPADVPLDLQELAERIEAVFPSRELAYAEKTTDTAITATTSGTAQTVVTASAITFDGSTAALVEFCAAAVSPAAVTNARIDIGLFQDGTLVQSLAAISSPAAVLFVVPVYGSKRLTPAAGSRTFSIRAWVSTGTGNVWAAGLAPAFIRVSRV